MSDPSPLTTHHSRRGGPAPRAFTLVEMLVALALTLLLVYSIAHFYAIVGDAVKDGRAMIELNQQLRAVVERLKSDLDLVTVPLVPWADEGGAAGYFEIREGFIASAASDADVNGNYRLDENFDIPPGNGGFGLPNVSDLLGDTDDIIAMTIRAAAIPFTGQIVNVLGPLPGNTNDGLLIPPNGSIPLNKIGNAPTARPGTAPYAEVVWWTSFSDTNGNKTWDLNESKYIHRRQLLIRPDLNIFHPGDTTPNSAGIPMSMVPYFFRIPVATGAQVTSPTNIYVYDMYQYCDVSMRPAGVFGGYVYFVANSLADLCKRENRFMHDNPVVAAMFNGSVAFPFALDLNPNYAGNLQPGLMPDNAASLATTSPRHNLAVNGGSQYRWVLFDGGRKGEDVMLSNALAFDVRVYDPDAIIRSYDGFNAVQPGDAGYAYANSYNFQQTHSPFAVLGTGAFVDVGYGIPLGNFMPFLDPPHSVKPVATALILLGVQPGGTVSPFQPTLGNSRFAGFPAGPSPAYQFTLGFTYDTWTLAYERDGIDQDGLMGIDQFTNGLDDNGIPGGNIFNGVDDISERETVPPYPYPLRGVQIRIRLIEPATRQVRQATVESDFIPE